MKNSRKLHEIPQEAAALPAAGVGLVSPLLRYISQICRHTLHIHIFSYISVKMYIYPIRYMYIYTAELIYTTICQSDMSPDPAPAVCPTNTTSVV